MENFIFCAVEASFPNCYSYYYLKLCFQNWNAFRTWFVALTFITTQEVRKHIRVNPFLGKYILCSQNQIFVSGIEAYFLESNLRFQPNKAIQI